VPTKIKGQLIFLTKSLPVFFQMYHVMGGKMRPIQKKCSNGE